MIDPLPRGLDAATFVARAWHRRALLLRNALPDFEDLFTFAQLRALAARDDVESRLVVRDGARFDVLHGPLRRAAWRELPARRWTLLVQGTNLHDDRADRLMRRFAFLPYARLDDVMVSYATPGGGVGPHVDSYDVFLLQGSGRRRWRYGRQRDLALKPGAPLKILRRFEPRHDHVLSRGDMLYLPPQIAHDGIAVDTCTTYSIGFRAPAATELAEAFLDFVRDRIDLPGRYADPDLSATSTPALIDAAMHARIAAMLAPLRPDRSMLAEFVGVYLSEPKPDVWFEPPRPALTPSVFARAARRGGVALDRRTQMLYDRRHLFINGIACELARDAAAWLTPLANARALAAAACAALPATALLQLHDWYRDGYLHVAS